MSMGLLNWASRVVLRRAAVSPHCRALRALSKRRNALGCRLGRLLGPFDGDPDIYGIRALNSCRARPNTCSIRAQAVDATRAANVAQGQERGARGYRALERQVTRSGHPPG